MRVRRLLEVVCVVASAIAAGATLGANAATSDASALAAAAARFVGAPRTIGLPIVAAPFATVSYVGTVEGRRGPGRLLFRRYPFGWQLIDSSIPMRRCDLLAQGVSADATSVLLPNVMDGATAASCPAPRPLEALSRDEIAVREIAQRRYRGREAVSPVIVAGAYALVDWHGVGGGQWLLRRTAGGWQTVTNGGGEFSACDLVRLDVPPFEARRLLLAFVKATAPGSFERTNRERLASVSHCR